jgi:hypothetical protein
MRGKDQVLIPAVVIVGVLLMLICPVSPELGTDTAVVGFARSRGIWMRETL